MKKEIVNQAVNNKNLRDILIKENGHISLKVGENEYSATDLLGKFFENLRNILDEHVKSNAEKKPPPAEGEEPPPEDSYANTPIPVCITIPPEFIAEERKSILEAAQKCGLNVVRLVEVGHF